MECIRTDRHYPAITSGRGQAPGTVLHPFTRRYCSVVFLPPSPGQILFRPFPPYFTIVNTRLHGRLKGILQDIGVDATTHHVASESLPFGLRRDDIGVSRPPYEWALREVLFL
jgi:hypothetical protein